MFVISLFQKLHCFSFTGVIYLLVIYFGEENSSFRIIEILVPISNNGHIFISATIHLECLLIYLLKLDVKSSLTLVVWT